MSNHMPWPFCVNYPPLRFSYGAKYTFLTNTRYVIHGAAIPRRSIAYILRKINKIDQWTASESYSFVIKDLYIDWTINDYGDEDFYYVAGSSAGHALGWLDFEDIPFDKINCWRDVDPGLAWLDSTGDINKTTKDLEFFKLRWELGISIRKGRKNERQSDLPAQSL